MDFHLITSVAYVKGQQQKQENNFCPYLVLVVISSKVGIDVHKSGWLLLASKKSSIAKYGGWRLRFTANINQVFNRMSSTSFPGTRDATLEMRLE